ncbi:muscle M-line assembly protein unc-89-like isoform X3 [Artemia franciscana]|uniref:muscle M-line assembly protein unc-89-like isoform X3 n=1 Tax=Artemia franciscana TaxID=6661 RepID=UPI0032DA0576
MINSIWSFCGACPAIDKIPPEYRHARNRRQGWDNSTQESAARESYPVIENEPSSQGVLEPLVSQPDSSSKKVYESNESVEFESSNDTVSINGSPSIKNYGSFCKSHSEGPSPRISPLQHRKATASQRSQRNSLDRHHSRSPQRSRNTSPFSSQTGMELSSGKSEYNVKFGWPPGGQSCQRSEQVKPVEVLSKLNNSTESQKSSTMNTLYPAQTKTANLFKSIQGGTDNIALMNGDGNSGSDSFPKEDKQLDREYRTEYRRKFRPFSLYQYVDGHFEKARSVGDPIASEEVDSAPAPTEPGKAQPWHKEVTELRKKAIEFKQRGWGIESLPEHLHSLYMEQGTVWDQVSRRSTLAALALASVPPRTISRDGSEPNRRIQTKPGKGDKLDSQRYRSRDDSSRPRRDHSIAARSDRSTMSAPLDRRSASLGKQRQPLAVSSAPTSAQSTPKIRLGTMGRSVSVGRDARAKRAARTPTSTAPPLPVNGEGYQARRKIDNSGENRSRDKRNKSRSSSPKPKRSMSVRAPVRNRQTPPANVSKSRSFTHPNTKTDTSYDPALKDEILLHPLQKAPAEPTRVKSPETLLVRSPDPVNWTVPIEPTKPLNPVQGVKQNSEGPRCLGELRVTMNVRPLSKPANSSAPSAGVRFKKPLEEMIPPAGPPVKHPIEIHSKPSSVVSPMKIKDVNANAEASINGHKFNSPTEVSRFEPSPLKSPEAKKFSEKHDIPVGKVEPIRVQPISRPLPGSTLRCLEDPSFLFDTPKPVIPPATEKSGGTKVIEPTQQYRVLEAEGVPSDVLYQPTAFNPYKVLEAPGSPKDGIAAPLVSPSSGKSLASDVLEKARSRFDRFWGKKDGV